MRWSARFGIFAIFGTLRFSPCLGERNQYTVHYLDHGDKTCPTEQTHVAPDITYI